MTFSDLDKFLDEQPVPGLVALGTSPTETFYEHAVGTTNTEGGEPLTINSPHAIMSMTKPVTSLAILQLIESGDLRPTDPVHDFLPAWRNREVIASADTENKTYATRALSVVPTIHHLLTNTVGLSYAFCNETLYQLRPESEQPDFPLLHEPGDQWTYGTGTRVLGEILSVIKGRNLESVLKELIFDPLNMQNTGFSIRPDQVHPHVHRSGAWYPNDLMPIIEDGDRGLISTAPDYARFVRCLLNEGAPLVSPETFQLALTNQIGDLFVREQPAVSAAFTYPFPSGDGIDKFSYGFQIHQQDNPHGRKAGSLSWCGLLNTYFWADPASALGGILMMQVLPLYSPTCLAALTGFEQRLYESVS